VRVFVEVNVRACIERVGMYCMNKKRGVLDFWNLALLPAPRTKTKRKRD
jgi:hypothetical protein